MVFIGFELQLFHAFKVGIFRLTHGEKMSFCEELLTVQRLLQSRCSLATNRQFAPMGCTSSVNAVEQKMESHVRSSEVFVASDGSQHENSKKTTTTSSKLYIFFVWSLFCMSWSQGKQVSCWVMVFESSLVLEVLGTAFDHHIWTCFYECFFLNRISSKMRMVIAKFQPPNFV